MNIYELESYIIVNQTEYDKLKSFSRDKNIISYEICGCCGHNFNIEYGSCYNIRCEKYLRNNKQLFTFDNNEFYSVPVVKRLILSEKEASEIENNIKNYERFTKIL